MTPPTLAEQDSILLEDKTITVSFSEAIKAKRDGKISVLKGSDRLTLESDYSLDLRGGKLLINLKESSLVEGASYKVRILEGGVVDHADNEILEVDTSEVVAPDVTPPTLAEQDSILLEDKTITVSFSEAIKAKSDGKIIVFKGSDRLTLVSDYTLALQDYKLLITLKEGSLVEGVSYKVRILEGGVVDNADNEILEVDTSEIVAPDVTPPTLAEQDSILLEDKTITVSFSEAIKDKDDDRIIVFKGSDRLTLGSDYTLTLQGDKLLINLESSSLVEGASYKVSISEGGVVDNADNGNLDIETDEVTVLRKSLSLSDGDVDKEGVQSLTITDDKKKFKVHFTKDISLSSENDFSRDDILVSKDGGSLDLPLELEFYGNLSGVLVVDYSGVGDMVLTGEVDGSLRIWDADTSRLLKTIESEGRSIQSAKFSPDGTKIATTTHGGRIVDIWDVGNYQKVQDISYYTSFLEFSSDGSKLLLLGLDKGFKIWHFSDKDPVDEEKDITIDFEMDKKIRQIFFSDLGDKIVSIGEDNKLTVWGVDGTSLWLETGKKSAINDGKFSPLGDKLALAYENKTAEILASSDGSVLFVLEGHTKPLTRVEFSPDGTKLVSVGEDNLVKMWSVVDGSLLSTLTGHSAVINDIIFSSDSRKLATASDDKTVKIWDVDTSKLLRDLPHSSKVLDIDFSSDGGRLVSGISHVPRESVHAKVWEMDYNIKIEGSTMEIEFYSPQTTGEYIVDILSGVLEDLEGNENQGFSTSEVVIKSSFPSLADGDRSVEGTQSLTVREGRIFTVHFDEEINELDEDGVFIIKDDKLFSMGDIDVVDNRIVIRFDSSQEEGVYRVIIEDGFVKDDDGDTNLLSITNTYELKTSSSSEYEHLIGYNFEYDSYMGMII